MNCYLGANTKRSRSTLRLEILTLAILITAPGLVGCWSASDRELVVYVALDREFSQPILERFHQQTGIRVLAKYDVESTKTVGLTNAIIAEADRPRCDVFWNNEVLNTVRLADKGLLAEYDSPQRQRFPSAFRDPQHRWTGFAARARILIVNKNRLPDPDTWPTSIQELANPVWAGRVAVAKPLFGTTATHATVLFEKLGIQPAREFFERVQSNAAVMSGNKQVALAVARGQYDWGLTDTDDAIIEMERGMPVAIVYPDQADDQWGMLYLPNTVAMIRGAPNDEHARQLIDYLLSAQVEEALAAGPSAQIPLANDVATSPRVAKFSETRAMEVNFVAIAEHWDAAARDLQEIFMRAE